jgi:hypothetical protein
MVLRRQPVMVSTAQHLTDTMHDTLAEHEAWLSDQPAAGAVAL